jgi:hypothetical protein
MFGLDATLTQRVLTVLQEAGFVHGKYGDVDYDLRDCMLLPDDDELTNRIHVFADGRKIAYVDVLRSGEAILTMQLAEWLHSKGTTAVVMEEWAQFGPFKARTKGR